MSSGSLTTVILGHDDYRNILENRLISDGGWVLRQGGDGSVLVDTASSWIRACLDYNIEEVLFLSNGLDMEQLVKYYNTTRKETRVDIMGVAGS